MQMINPGALTASLCVGLSEVIPCRNDMYILRGKNFKTPKKLLSQKRLRRPPCHQENYVCLVVFCQVRCVFLAFLFREQSLVLSIIYSWVSQKNLRLPFPSESICLCSSKQRFKCLMFSSSWLFPTSHTAQCVPSNR